MGKEHKRSRRHKVKAESTSAKPRDQLFPCRCPPGYPKQNQQIIKDKQEAENNYNYSKLQQKHRPETVSNELLGGGGLNRFGVATTLALVQL